MADFSPSGLQTALTVGIGVVMPQKEMVQSSYKHIVVLCGFLLPAILTQMLTEDFVCLQKLFSLRLDNLIHVQILQIKLQTDQ